jgi:hypothetical protein
VMGGFARHPVAGHPLNASGPKGESPLWPDQPARARRLMPMKQRIARAAPAIRSTK